MLTPNCKHKTFCQNLLFIYFYKTKNIYQDLTIIKHFYFNNTYTSFIQVYRITYLPTKIIKPP